MAATIPEEAMAEWSGGRLDEFALRMDERFDHLEERMDEKFDRVDEKFIQLEKRADEGFGRVDEKFVRVDERFRDVSSRLERLDVRVENLRQSMVVGVIAICTMMFAGFGALITLFALHF